LRKSSNRNQSFEIKKKQNFFLVLSGENLTLPLAEAESILKAENHQYRIQESLNQILRISADGNSIESIAKRAAFTRLCCLELFSCNATFKEIYRNIENIHWTEFLEIGDSFAIKIQKVGEAFFLNKNFDLQRGIGKIIMNCHKRVSVNLNSPTKTFVGVLSRKRFFFGIKIIELPSRSFIERRPSNRPFFHPSAMQAKLARCMVNLAQPKKNDLVLDPFCGTATTLVEAGLIGCKILGTDIKLKMIRGSRENLEYQKLKAEGLLVADALKLPFSKTDYLVTDPPYGRSSTTLGIRTKKLLREFLSNIKNGSIKIKRICMSAPKDIELGKIIEDLGFRLEASHYFYVHRSLTREIFVLR
jgi:tRNA (guanine10-N2)-dimethyltransferase